ncbi:MAG TPA: phosphotransferase [Anaerolineales bacterium]
MSEERVGQINGHTMSLSQSFENITTEWLTDLLQMNNLLKRGSVEEIYLQSISDVPFGAPKIRRLEIEYSIDAISDVPNKIILKIAPKEREFLFYTRIIERMGEVSTPRCYLAQQNEGKSQAIFLLEDLSGTHFQTEYPVSPSLEHCEMSIDCLASFHAFWWNDPRLETKFRQKVTRGNYWTGRLNDAIDKLPAFLDFIGDRLPTDRQGIYEKVLASSNHHWMPDSTRNAKTFLHGDIHFWNFLFPKDPSKNEIRIFDWNSWDIGKGTNDFAYMIGLHWYPDLRQRREQFLLKRYYSNLLEQGISNYSWDDCWLDYRESCIMNLFIPVWQWQSGTSAIVWWSHLERSFLTFNDLDLIELL